MIALKIRMRTVAATVVMAVLAGPAVAQDTWTNKQSMPVHRYKHGAAVIDGRVHVVGGVAVARGCTYLATHDVYDPATDSWWSAAPMSTARSFAGVAALDGKLYVVGGETGCSVGTQTASVEVYDPVSNTWSAGTPLPAPRARMGVATIDGKLYAVGGYDGSNALATVSVYDLSTHTWSAAPSLPAARRDMTVAVIDSKLYVAGGFDNAGHALNSLAIFNPGTGTWSSGAAMTLARGFAGGGVADGQFWVIGGFYFTGTSHTVPTVSVYDPSTNTWADEHSLPAARDEMGTATTTGAIYALGGWSGSSVADSTLVFATDTIPPVLTLPSNMVLDPTSPAGAVVTYAASATDNVDGPVPVTCAPASGTQFPIGTTTVSCSASDSHGNAAAGSFTVTVRSASQIVSDLVNETDAAGFQQGTHLLQNAQRSVNAPHTEAACGQLAAFVNQVQAQAGKQLTDAAASAWIASANAARAALGCN